MSQARNLLCTRFESFFRSFFLCVIFPGVEKNDERTKFHAEICISGGKNFTGASASKFFFCSLEENELPVSHVFGFLSNISTFFL